MRESIIKGIIFDCDGTLVDSEYLCNLAFEVLLKQYDIFVKAEQLMLQFRGAKLSNIIQEMQASYGVTFNDDFAKNYRTKVDELFFDILSALR